MFIQKLKKLYRVIKYKFVFIYQQIIKMNEIKNDRIVTQIRIKMKITLNNQRNNSMNTCDDQKTRY